jgi:hypothetical protein
MAKKRRPPWGSKPIVVEEFLKLFEHWKLSPDKHEDVWKLLVALFMEHYRPPKPGVAGDTGQKKPGVKADPRHTVDDAILMFGVDQARRDGDGRGEWHIIRDIAKWNGWRTDNAAISTKWRRYQDLKRNGSRERQRVAALLRDILPSVEAHFAKK